jgi:hypothetical protein
MEDRHYAKSLQSTAQTSLMSVETDEFVEFTENSKKEMLSMYLVIQGVSGGMCQTLEGCSLCKVCQYNPKRLCPKLNGYRDNGQRKVWSSGGSMHCTCQLTSLIKVCP